MSLYTFGLIEDPAGAAADPVFTVTLDEILAGFPQDTATFNTAGNVVCLESLDRPYSLPVCSTPLVAWHTSAFDGGGLFQPIPTPEPSLWWFLAFAWIAMIVVKRVLRGR